MRCIAAVLVLGACGGSLAMPDASDGKLSTSNCAGTIAGGVPEPYRSLLHCVDVSVSATDLTITTTGLPPHDTYYYGSASPNHEAWDARGGAYHANPNTLAATPATFVIPLAPIAKNAVIDTTTVDGQANNPSVEYRGGPVGVALDSVLLFDALAAPGDDIANEQYTFDEWNAHPTNTGAYHYHRDSPGPLAVAPSGIEAYGIMCDGTFVLGCTELDGSGANEPGLDAQNGHVGDVGAITARYHVHICAAFASHPRPYTPEVQYYSTCVVH